MTVNRQVAPKRVLETCYCYVETFQEYKPIMPKPKLQKKQESHDNVNKGPFIYFIPK